MQKTALKLAKKIGLINVTRADLCKEFGIAEGSFQHVVGRSFTSFMSKLDTEFGPSLPQPKTVTHRRRNPKLCRAFILKAAVGLSEKQGWRQVTQAMIAEHIGVSRPLVAHYLGSAKQARDAVMIYAIRNEVLAIVGQGMSRPKCPLVELAPHSLRIKAYKAMDGSV